MVNWTPKMKEELLYTRNPTLISKKYKMAYETARRQLLKMLNAKNLTDTKTNDNEKPKKQPLPTKLKEKKAEELKQQEIKVEEQPIQKTEEIKKHNEIFDNIEKIIIDPKSLTNKGINFYITDSRKMISDYDKTISDYRHILEDSYDSLSQDELIDISKNIGIIGRKRRLFKNEIEFIQNNKTETQGFIDFIKKINEQTIRLQNKLYNTRILKEDLGHVIVTSKHNDLIKTLEEENKELKERLTELEQQNTETNTIPDDIKDRLFNLEKYNLKEQRKKLGNKKKMLQ